MASFGNTGASSLISSANAAAAKTQALNDSLANYQYELSAKDDAAYQTYQSYLATQAKRYSKDPSKTLTYEKALTSAQKSYTSATIGRIGTQINYGNADLNSKYSTLSQLRDAAMQNGDDALAQSLESQMASTSVAIQNKQLSDAAAADRASSKAQTANKAGVDQIDHKLAQQENLFKLAVQHGQLTVRDYQQKVAELLQTKDQLYQDAANGKYGDLGTNQTDYLTKSDALRASDSFVKAISAGQSANKNQPTEYNKTNPTQRDAQGNLISTPTSLPGGQVVQNPDGTFSTAYNYGFNAAESGLSGGDTAENRLKAAKAGGTYIIPNIVAMDGQPKGSGGDRGGNGGQLIADQANPGAFFVVDQNGNKHYVSTDPKANLQRSQTPIIPGKTDKPLAVDGGSTDPSFWGNNGILGQVKGLFRGNSQLDRSSGIIAPGSSITSSLLANHQHLIDRQNSAAALAKAQAAVAAARATMAPTVPARIATPVIAKNLTPAGKTVIAAAPIKTPTVSQAQAAAANFVGANGGYKTNIVPAKAPQSLAAKVGSFFGF